MHGTYKSERMAFNLRKGRFHSINYIYVTVFNCDPYNLLLFQFINHEENP